MSRAVLALVIALLAPLAAGCLADDPEPTPTAAVAASATEAGAIEGEAPSAAKNPYQVQAGDAGMQASATAYPVSIQTNPPKAPYSTEFAGEFQPYQCLPTGGGLPLGGLGLASGGQWFDVAEAFAKDDVFSFDVTLTFTNTDDSWAELHLWHQFDGVSNYWNEPTSEGRGEIVTNFTGQGFIINDDFFAGVGVDCWYGQLTAPIPYTIGVTIRFAEGAIPSQVPVLLNVPEGATRLFVTGLALDASRGVTSHYRVFAPDDSLACECALGSDETTDVVELAEPGDFVILVDHTENGFITFALDRAPEEPLKPLTTRFETYSLAGSEGGAVDETLQIELPSTPLGLWAWVFAPGNFSDPADGGAGHNVKVTVANARGDVLRTSMVGYLTYHASVPEMFGTNDWYAIPMDGDWEFYVDHHAFDLGAHTVTVKADQMRGDARMFANFYDRASA